MLVTVALLRGFVLDTVVVDSGSMSPTLCGGDRLLVARLGDHTQVGDVVVFDDPRTSERTVKRVVATGGRQVEIRDGVLRVDGRVRHEEYVDLRTVDGTFFGPVRVPQGDVFVLGDNREVSIDSRDFGPLPKDVPAGEVVGKLWSSCG